MPSVQWNIRDHLSTDSLKIVSFCNYTAGHPQVLRDYVSRQGINYPMVFDQSGEYFELYQAGSSHGTKMPVYIIIDKRGIIRYRYNGEFDKIVDISEEIEELISENSG